ncbi:hypothetical protein [Bowmanella pacifica]|uniref:PEP-CTERM protein-sorting domain-containing protein n=1 Tax=Bowmanella pacifica TaxID=502051 RepID=A0A917Z410_9ALTE|nr:hypothetical protein [Bowmanella pacifica]GGO74513.1 hypothetical protein GCM10010982_37510 [Bowmanella pacifica]
MKRTSIWLLPLCLCIAPPSQANLIANGDFQSCDFSSWQQDSDGLGSPGTTGDFSIENTAGNCRALLTVDDGQSAQAFFANTLYQQLTLTALTGEHLWLHFDWAFFGTDGAPLTGDYFHIALNDGLGNLYGADGQLGTLLQSPTNGQSSYGSGMFSVLLDSSLYNQSGWYLDFTLGEGTAIGDGLFSTLAIDNVRLESVSAAISEPALPALFFLGLMTMGLLRREEG